MADNILQEFSLFTDW